MWLKNLQGNLSSLVANISQPLSHHQNLSSITLTKTMCKFAGAVTVHQAEAVSYRILLSCPRLSLQYIFIHDDFISALSAGSIIIYHSGSVVFLGAS